MNIAGSVALITGAGRGIGRAVPLTLGRHGAKVVLAARSADELEEVRNEIVLSGGSAHAVSADLTKRADVERLFAEIQTTYQRLEILLNNAGIGKFAPVRDMPSEDFDAMWALNVKAVTTARSWHCL